MAGVFVGLNRSALYANLTRRPRFSGIQVRIINGLK